MALNFPMWNRIVLRKRIYLVLTALVLITFIGGVVMIWYTYRIEDLITAVADENMVALETAEDLQIALANQKGFVSYYFLDGDPAWLRQLGQYRQIFADRLEKTREFIDSERQKEVLDKIEREYLVYIDAKDRVIECYKNRYGDRCAEFHLVTGVITVIV